MRLHSVIQEDKNLISSSVNMPPPVKSCLKSSHMATRDFSFQGSSGEKCSVLLKSLTVKTHQDSFLTTQTRVI